MSQAYFSKLDSKEKQSRLLQLSNSKADITIWVKGQKDKFTYQATDYVKSRDEILLDSKEDFLPTGSSLLCSFEMRGMSFFSRVILTRSVNDQLILQFKEELYKSERRSSYRLLTYPIYEVYAEFDLDEAYEGGKVIDLKSRTNQTALFKNFLKLIENRTDDKQHQTIKYRVQDLSATGMSLHIGELEAQFFSKDFMHKEVHLRFIDEVIVIPEVKVVYVVDYIASDKNIKRFKVGLHFPNLPTNVDDQLGKKINKLLREVDFNKDFENFLK